MLKDCKTVSLDTSLGWTTPTLSVCPHRRDAPGPWPFSWTSSRHILKASCLSCSWSTRAEHSAPSGISPEQRDRIISINLLSTPLLMQSSWLAFWATSTHDWLRIKFSCTSIPQSFLGLLPTHLTPSLCQYCWLSSPRCGIMHLALENFMRFTCTQSSRLSRSDLYGMPSLPWITCNT